MCYKYSNFWSGTTSPQLTFYRQIYFSICKCRLKQFSKHENNFCSAGALELPQPIRSDTALITYDLKYSKRGVSNTAF